ncbi:MAG: ABC transporter substrate-binding protein [Lachnospiraceae bacterium]|nr:ABC transporter substrate-binding protein [Lachnospiraceae bacterium]
MKKKIMSYLLTGALLTFVLAGCGGSAGNSGNSAASTADSVAQTEASTPAPADTSAAAQTTEAEPEPEAPAAEPVTLRIAYMPNYAALWAVTTAREKGFFEEEGITVELTEFADGPTEIAAMESGSIDLSYIGPGAHRLCATGNAEVFLLQQLGDADCVIGLKSKGVESLEDLKGKTVAYASGTSSEQILSLALESVGLTMDDIEAYDMDTTNMVTAAISGSVDALATWSPYSLTIMEELGDDAIKFCSNVSFSDVTVTPASWVCTPAYADENPEILVRFIRAMYKAMDYGSKEENMQEVAGFVAEQCKTDVDAAYEQRGDGSWFTKDRVIAAAKDGSMVEYYTLQQNQFIAAEKVDAATAIDPADFVLTELMIQAGE